MSSEFRTFTKGSILYAQHADLIDQMWDEVKAEIDRFQNALQRKVEESITLGIEEYNTTRAWWTADETLSPGEYGPYLWLHRKAPKIIAPGELEVYVELSAKDDVAQKLVRENQAKLALPPTCKFEKYVKLYKVLIHYGESDPVVACAEPIVSILENLHEVSVRLSNVRKARK